MVSVGLSDWLVSSTTVVAAAVSEVVTSDESEAVSDFPVDAAVSAKEVVCFFFLTEVSAVSVSVSVSECEAVSDSVTNSSKSAVSSVSDGTVTVSEGSSVSRTVFAVWNGSFGISSDTFLQEEKITEIAKTTVKTFILCIMYIPFNKTKILIYMQILYNSLGKKSTDFCR